MYIATLITMGTDSPEAMRQGSIDGEQKAYAGNRSDAVKLDNPYYKEPAPEKKPAAAAPQSPSGTQTKPPKEEKTSGSNAATPSGSDNSTGQ